MGLLYGCHKKITKGKSMFALSNWMREGGGIGVLLKEKHKKGLHERKMVGKRFSIGITADLISHI